MSSRLFAVLIVVSCLPWSAMALPVPMKALQGEWKETNGQWDTMGKRPPAGWYLRSEHQYDIGSFSFELKRPVRDEDVFVYLRDWQIVLREDSVTARYSGFSNGKEGKRTWPVYWYSATRPLDLPAGTWAQMKIEALPMGIAITVNGKEILKFESPEEEWGERIRTSGKYTAFTYQFPSAFPDASAAKQILVLQSYGSGMSIRSLQVNGTDVGEAENFHQQVAEPSVLPPDEQLPLFRPTGLVDVNWKLDPKKAAEVAQLPQVADWAIPESAFVSTDSDSINKPAPGETVYPEVMHYNVGAADPGQAPKSLAIKKRAATMPQEFQVGFNLKTAGDYTLEYDWSKGMGWGPHVIEISVDGKPLVSEVYRGLNKFGITADGSEWIPLKLSAGPHVANIRIITERFGYHILMKLLRFPLQSVRLEKGIREPWVVADIRNPEERSMRPPATEDDLLLGDRSGATLNYRIVGFQPGESYKVILTFNDEESNRVGSRLMDVLLNNATVEKGLDVFKEVGWGRRLDKSYTVKAVAGKEGVGEIELRIQGTKRKAILSGITVENSGNKIVFRDNVGWEPALALALERKMGVRTAKILAEGTSAEPPKWTPEERFDGHNLVANPHFSLASQDRENKPQFWYSGPEMARLEKKKGDGNPFSRFNLYPGTGEYVQDPAVGKESPGSLRIGKTNGDFAVLCNQAWVDPNKLQKFSLQVKGGSGSTPVRAVLLWFAGNADGGLVGSELQYLGATKGEPVQPGADWKEAFAEAMPPPGAYYVGCAIEAADNAEPLWIDDAEFNGYGAEPLEITRSLAGYHPAGAKQMIVKSFSGEPVHWTMKNGKGQIVAEGDLKENQYEWFSKRHYFPLTFDSVRQQDKYTVLVTQGDKSANAEVEIRSDIYSQLAKTMMSALHMKRVNYPVKNAHDAELLDYAAVPETVSSDRYCIYEPVQTGRQIDLIGGYYDAGDMIKHTEFWPSVALATMSVMDRSCGDEMLKKAAQSERDWLLAAYYKFFLPDGTQYTTAKPQGFELDNIPLYSADPEPAVVLRVGQAGGACAMAAWELRESDPELSRRYHKIAETCYENFGYWKVVQAAGEVGPNEISAAAKALWAEMYLAKFPDGSRYADRLTKTCDVLAQGLKKRAYADLGEMSMGADKNGAAIQDCVWVAALFARTYPDHAGVPALKEGLRAFIEHVKELSAQTVWGQAAAMNGVVPGQPLRRYPQPKDAERFRMVGYWSMLAYSLAEAGLVLEDADAIRLAERQLQWCLGKNPSDLSAVAGVGDKWIVGGDKLFQQDQFFLNWLKSSDRGINFPGNVATTAWRGGGDAEVQNGAIAPLVIYPNGYVMLPAQPNYAVAPGPGGETYLPLIAQFNLAASSVAAGLKWIDEQNGAKAP